MKVLLYNNPENVTEYELERDLKIIPTWRRGKALKYRFLMDRVLCTKAYLLLKEGLEEEYGIKDNPEFIYLEHGKPVLKNRENIHFNLSHCNKAVLCVLDGKPVGCDIEEIPNEISMPLCRKCFNEDEINNIINSEKPCVEFAKYWTRKETIIKHGGMGITVNLKNILNEESEKNKNIQTVVCEEKGYVYSILTYNK
ncbi:MAG: 4'-phosphopantetheinyl transferase superfamily protein [Lachnospiraceae bacterium]|nr:4'-phosphopantetheinyl transferase superfamily protein [Lachnospiraceae bacterium]